MYLLELFAGRDRTAPIAVRRLAAGTVRIGRGDQADILRRAGAIYRQAVLGICDLTVERDRARELPGRRPRHRRCHRQPVRVDAATTGALRAALAMLDPDATDDEDMPIRLALQLHQLAARHRALADELERRGDGPLARTFATIYEATERKAPACAGAM